MSEVRYWIAELNFEKSKNFIKFLILKYDWFYLEYALSQHAEWDLNKIEKLLTGP